MPKLHKVLLILIILLFSITRFYKISEIPSSVYWDEASIGYNAYSIGQTGRDEWGKFLPIHFRAFGEFKLPVYIYSVVPFVKIFGLNEFSVRFPAVLFSLGVVILTFFLASGLTGKTTIGLWSSFFITISPWFFIFSRTGYEATAGLMLYLFGIYLFLRFKEDKWFLVFSIVSFILSAYSYNSFRIISPLTLLLLIFFEQKQLSTKFKKIIPAITLSVFLIILSAVPIYRLYAYDAGGFRLQVVGSSGSAAVHNYLSHLNPNFLFISGDTNLRSQQANFGQLYFPDLILIPLGLLYIICRKSKYHLLVLLLLLIGPIPAALTKESPHALRSISIVPFFVILSAMGVVSFFSVIVRLNRGIWIPACAGMTVTVIFLGFFTNYFKAFLTIYPVQSAKDWQYGYKKFYVDYGNEFAKYDHVIISDEYAQPYIFALFYLKYDPNKFQKEAVRNNVDNWGFSTVSKFDKFEFGKVDQLTKTAKGKSLIFYEQENY